MILRSLSWVSLLYVPNFLWHLRNEIKWWTFSLWNCYHLFLRSTFSRNKFSKVIQMAQHLVNETKCCKICTCPVWFYFILLFYACFWGENWKMLISSHWNNSVFCDQWKMMSYLNMSYGKISHFVSFPLFVFTYSWS